MKVGSLFSGIGGFDLGLERAGLTPVWQVEINDYCQRVLKKHWPHVPKFGDIKSVDFRELQRPDLLCGGFPCQSVSCAGKRKGVTDDRWLWPEFYRAIRDIRPRWALVENVTGLLSIDSGRVFGGILRDLAQSGYDASWSVLSACSLGAPHTRERLFLVAYPQSQRWKSWRFDYPNEMQESQRLFEKSFWSGGKTKSEFYRMADGIPPKLHRLKGLGNAVVPQLAELIGRRIKEAVQRG